MPDKGSGSEYYALSGSPRRVRPKETKALLLEQRDRARELVEALARRLDDEHDKNRCGCGKPSVGDCATLVLLNHAERHVAYWTGVVDA